MSETVKCSEMRDKCVYAVKFKDSEYCCDFIGVTGKRRGCDPEKCDKFKPRTIGDRSKSKIKY